jgi:hypothetical protein
MMIPNDKYIFQSVSTRQFFEWLQEVSPQNSRPRILIFTETKKGANALCRELRYEQFEAGAIHGDKDQAERDAILNNFRQGKCQILVATDVAQRGLDIKDVEYAAGFMWFQAIFALPRNRRVNSPPKNVINTTRLFFPNLVFGVGCSLCGKSNHTPSPMGIYSWADRFFPPFLQNILATGYWDGVFLPWPWGCATFFKVVNYHMPNTIEDYVHRIGRTGRAGKSGTAVSFFGCDFRSNDKVRFAKRLVKVMQAIGKRGEG